jgi:hypothetical protein
MNKPEKTKEQNITINILFRTNIFFIEHFKFHLQGCDAKSLEKSIYALGLFLFVKPTKALIVMKNFKVGRL